MQIVQIPFAGLCYSVLDSELDYVESRNCENWAGDDNGDEGPDRANARVLNSSDYAAIVWDCIDWSKAHDHVAREYAEYFDKALSELAGFETGFKFESMVSPREYNFTTDRLFCFVQDAVMTRMYAEIDADVFARVIDERHSSRSGFSSFYSNDVADWRAKPIAEYDHNELATVLLAFIETKGSESELEESVIDNMREGNVFDSAFDEGMDYPKFETSVAEKRDEKHGALVGYSVLVGNLGNVHTGTDEATARKEFADYVELSKSLTGRASGEPVTLMKDGEIIESFDVLGEDSESDD